MYKRWEAADIRHVYTSWSIQRVGGILSCFKKMPFNQNCFFIIFFFFTTVKKYKYSVMKFLGYPVLEHDGFKGIIFAAAIINKAYLIGIE